MLGDLEAGKVALESVGAGLFFGLLLANTMEGFFADPIYGGNRDKIGWKLVGFPGVAAVYSEFIDKHNVPYKRRAGVDRGPATDTPSRWTSTAIRCTCCWPRKTEEAAMATKLKPVDVVMVGVGVTGAILAKELAEAGLKVVGIERGQTRDTYPDFQMPNAHDELKFQRRHELMQDLSRETITFRNNKDETALPMR